MDSHDRVYEQVLEMAGTNCILIMLATKKTHFRHVLWKKRDGSMYHDRQSEIFLRHWNVILWRLGNIW